MKEQRSHRLKKERRPGRGRDPGNTLRRATLPSVTKWVVGRFLGEKLFILNTSSGFIGEGFARLSGTRCHGDFFQENQLGLLWGDAVEGQ